MTLENIYTYIIESFPLLAGLPSQTKSESATNKTTSTSARDQHTEIREPI